MFSSHHVTVIFTMLFTFYVYVKIIEMYRCSCTLYLSILGGKVIFALVILTDIYIDRSNK